MQSSLLSSSVLATCAIGKNSEASALHSCGLSILVMKPSEHRHRGDLALCGALSVDRRALPDPLVRPSVVVVPDVLGHDAVEMAVVEHKDVVEALATERAEKTLADRIHVRRTNRRTEDPGAGGAGKRFEGSVNGHQEMTHLGHEELTHPGVPGRVALTQ
jgi:hypothetical protein